MVLKYNDWVYFMHKLIIHNHIVVPIFHAKSPKSQLNSTILFHSKNVLCVAISKRTETMLVLNGIEVQWLCLLHAQVHHTQPYCCSNTSSTVTDITASLNYSISFLKCPLCSNIEKNRNCACSEWNGSTIIVSTSCTSSSYTTILMFQYFIYSHRHHSFTQLFYFIPKMSFM